MTTRTIPGTDVTMSVGTQSDKGGRVWHDDLLVNFSGQLGRVVCWDPKEENSNKIIVNTKFLSEEDLP